MPTGFGSLNIGMISDSNIYCTYGKGHQYFAIYQSFCHDDCILPVDSFSRKSWPIYSWGVFETPNAIAQFATNFPQPLRYNSVHALPSDLTRGLQLARDEIEE
jgi:hypothetical protein